MAGNLSPLPNLQRLFDRVQELVAKFIAEVSVVNTAVASRGLRQLHQFIGVRVAAWRVIEARGQPKGAFLHAFTEHGPHVRSLGFAGRSVIPTYGADSKRGVTDDIGDVDGNFVIEHAQVFRNRRPDPR